MNLWSRICVSSVSCSGIQCESEGLTAAAGLIKHNHHSPAKNTVDILWITLPNLNSRKIVIT